jgi:CheY-like chemotaxis protein
MKAGLPARPSRILVVDDAAALRSVLRAFSVDQGYEVVAELASADF